jgi:hypothetical protein
VRPKLSWALFLIGAGAVSYFSEPGWPQRIILFALIVGGIAIWTRWMVRNQRY